MLKNRIKNLIDLIKNTEIEEIEVSSFWGAQKIKLSKNSPHQNVEKLKTKESDKAISDIDNKNLETSNSNLEISEENTDIFNNDKISNSEDNIELKNDELEYFEIKAPLVGTFYSSPKPSDPPFIKTGDKIKKGQTICIIEAMKIFNDIESDISGTVNEICIENGSPVEYDQVLIKILPD